MKEINSLVLFLVNLVLGLVLLAAVWTPMIFMYAALAAVPAMFAILFKIICLPAMPMPDVPESTIAE